MPATTEQQQPGADLDSRFRAVVAELELVPLGEMQTLCRQWRAVLDSAEAKRLAAEMRPGEDDKPTRRKAAAGGNRSRREAAKAAKRAAAVKKNPRLADDMDSGKLSSEQADTIADAASKSDGDAAVDQGLIDAVASAGVDAGRRIASDWLQKHADKDKVQSEHDRQHSQRRISTYVDAQRGTNVLKIEGSKAAIAELRNRIELRERQLWEADGGRDLARGKHKRSRDQRLFDAACDIILGAGGSGAGGRPSAVININANDPDESAEMVGVGPIADSVATEILERANIFINIHDLSGKTLWWARAKRRATLDQFIALVARDKGCVRCRAHWLRCEVHHLTPWNAPAKGETNIDELVLVCGPCHHDTHASELTIVRDANGTWTTRPATPDEIAPKRPHAPCRPKRPDRNSQPPTGAATTSGQQPPTEITTPTKKPSTPECSDDEAA